MFSDEIHKEEKDFICRADFDIFIEEFVDLKKYAFENMTKMNELLAEKKVKNKTLNNNTDALKYENSFLKKEHKQVIDLPVDDI